MMIAEQKKQASKELELHAREQLVRIMHLPGFPSEKVAQRDYVLAMLVLKSKEAISALVEDLVREQARNTWGDPRAPLASEVRRLAYERLERGRRALAACQLCDGSGCMTVWSLVTYKGGSLTVESAQRLRHVTNLEQANAEAEILAARIAADPRHARQAIITAAENCACNQIGRV